MVRFKDDPKVKETLFIDRYSSICGNCGRGASSDARKHDKVVGHYPDKFKRPEPCNVEFKFVSSNYTGMKARVTEMRPDLEWYSPWGVPESVQ